MVTLSAGVTPVANGNGHILSSMRYYAARDGSPFFHSDISHRTVETDRPNIMFKLGAHSSVKLALIVAGRQVAP